jgi:transcriptional regulator with XRE-family HTH domain
MSMTLSEYLQVERLKPSEFANRIRVRKRTVNRYLTGDRIPRRSIMMRIIKVTGGRVTADSFLPVRLVAA